MELTKFVNTLTILYISNHPTYQDTLDKLKAYFLNIDTAKSQNDGIEKFDIYYQESKKHYDIIIINLEASDPNIIDICDALRTKNNEQNIIIISQSNTYFSRLRQSKWQ